MRLHLPILKSWFIIKKKERKKKEKRHAPMTHEQKRHLQNKTGKSPKLKTCM